MMGNPRARYTQEFMIEAVRMVRGGQSMAAVAKILAISPKTLHNWVKADAAGKLNGAGKQNLQSRWRLPDCARSCRA
jgi:transposase-like protein